MRYGLSGNRDRCRHERTAMKQYHPTERRMSRAEYDELLRRSVERPKGIYDLDQGDSTLMELAKLGLFAGGVIALLAYGLMWGLR